jgi:hypothetical protein
MIMCAYSAALLVHAGLICSIVMAGPLCSPEGKEVRARVYCLVRTHTTPTAKHLATAWLLQCRCVALSENSICGAVNCCIEAYHKHQRSPRCGLLRVLVAKPAGQYYGERKPTAGGTVRVSPAWMTAYIRRKPPRGRSSCLKVRHVMGGSAQVDR